MSITKLFVKVFGEDIFTKISDESRDSAFTDEDALDCAVLRGNKPLHAMNSTVISKDKKMIPQNESILTEQINDVKNWLQLKLDAIEEKQNYTSKYHRVNSDGKLGPPICYFDINLGGTLRMSADKLTIRSQSNFSTILANTCIYSGRWMYEILLHTKGLMQIGFASNKCTFNENRGVGDSRHSYGYDGSKQQLWHISTKKYGVRWQVGDIITITIDVDNEKIEYYRNGKSMGLAVTRIEKGPGLVFYPAISLGLNQSVMANFGSMPYKYPVEGYMPFQPRLNENLEQAEVLLDYILSLSAIIARYNCCESKKKREAKFSTRKCVYSIFAVILFEKLTPLLFDTYVIYDKLLPQISSLCLVDKIPEPTVRKSSLQTGDKQSIIENVDMEVELEEEEEETMQISQEAILDAMLSLYWNHLESEEMKFVLKKIVTALLTDYTHTQHGLDYSVQMDVLKIMICLCKHKLTRKCLLHYKFFKKNCLQIFCFIRPPEFSFMEQLVPNTQAWTEGLGGNKERYLSIGDKIVNLTEPLYKLQCKFISQLLNNEDGDALTGSSRKIFTSKLRRYVIDITIENRPLHAFLMMQSSIQHPVEPQYSLSFICILLEVTRTIYEQHFNAKQPGVYPKYFFDGSLQYTQFDRLGGVPGHLRKIYRQELEHLFGSKTVKDVIALSHDPNTGLEDIDPFFVLGSNLVNMSVVGRTQGNQALFTHIIAPKETLLEVKPGNADDVLSIFELFDTVLMYYYSAGHRYIAKIAATRDEIATLNIVLNETKFYRQDVETKIKEMEKSKNDCILDKQCAALLELKSEFMDREVVFIKRLTELSRKQIWYRSIALGMKRRLLLIWLMDRVLATMNDADKMNPMLAFVPEVYMNVLPNLLDTVMDFCFHDVVAQYNIIDGECVVRECAKFLSAHAADAKIVLASCKDSLLQCLGTLTCHKSGITALELMPEQHKHTLIRALLRPYENRAWGQSNWLLLRFWLGSGFAFKDSRNPSIWQGGNELYSFGICRSRSKTEQHTGLLHNIAPPNPSKKFQILIGKNLIEDESYATAFLNSVLTQLNWAFSEFILLLQEIQNVAMRQEMAIFEPKQMKICSMCFELTVSLMRCLEFTISVAPDVFTDPSRPNSDLLLNRVYQLISQVLSRVTVPPGCFQYVIDLCSTDLHGVAHFPIITAALGILLALLRPELDIDKTAPKVTRVSRALLTDASFQFAHLEFTLGEIQTPLIESQMVPRGNFDPSTRGHIDPLTNEARLPIPTAETTKRIRADAPILKFALTDYPTHVSEQEVADVRKLIEVLRKKQALLSDITLPSEDSLCPICCAKPIAVIFYPCKHQSCNNCILQHLLNSKECFYCKTIIKHIETFDGKVIYRNLDDTSESSLILA